MQVETLDSIMDLARLYADQRGDGDSAFVTPDECAILVHNRARERYDLLVAARGHEYFETVSTFTTVANTATVSLPSDFYELLSLYVNWGTNDPERIDALESIDDRQYLIYPANTWQRGTDKKFRIRANVIEFFPTPQSAFNLEMRYVPTYSEALNLDGINGWNLLVALWVAIDLRTIQGLPSGDLQKLADKQEERVQLMAADRAAAHPARVRDVIYGDRYHYRRWKRLGPVP